MFAAGFVYTFVPAAKLFQVFKQGKYSVWDSHHTRWTSNGYLVVSFSGLLCFGMGCVLEFYDFKGAVAFCLFGFLTGFFVKYAISGSYLYSFVVLVAGEIIMAVASGVTKRRWLPNPMTATFAVGLLGSGFTQMLHSRHRWIRITLRIFTAICLIAWGIGFFATSQRSGTQFLDYLWSTFGSLFGCVIAETIDRFLLKFSNNGQQIYKHIQVTSQTMCIGVSLVLAMTGVLDPLGVFWIATALSLPLPFLERIIEHIFQRMEHSNDSEFENKPLLM